MKFTAQVYDTKRKRYTERPVIWTYSPLTDSVSIKVQGMAMSDIEPSHLQALHREAKKLSKLLSYEKRLDIMKQLTDRVCAAGKLKLTMDQNYGY